MSSSLTEDQHRDAARRLFEMRQREFPNERSPLYNSVKDAWLLLAVLAGCLDKGKVDMDAINESGLRLDEAQLREIIHRMLNNQNQQQRTKIAEVCCSMHRLACGRCACR